jgi:hypothetical protein
MAISGDFIVTIHRRPFDVLRDLRERYPSHPARGELFLVWKIMDTVTSTFFPVLTGSTTTSTRSSVPSSPNRPRPSCSGSSRSSATSSTCAA